MLKGKVALVTGSSRGLGSEIAYRLAYEGCSIVIHYYQNKKMAEEICHKIRNKYHVKCIVCQADVSNEDEVVNMMKKIIQIFGTIDILVNNAGICKDCLFEEKTKEDFQNVLNVNLLGTFFCSREFGKNIDVNKGGVIVNIASNNGIDVGHPMSVDYDASKAAVISLTHNLARQYAPMIRVNAVAPGWIETDMSRIDDDEFMKAFIEEESRHILLGRFASRDEVANVVIFLCSEKSSYINNTIIDRKSVV